ncbi:uncharacterized protein LOC119178242 [Rhipicephalus microplus]|uniref:uncharacterized protein LOC119178242 n=1 Tax=Rhipicephalus microplus TaxID=6941 RepID=UPI001889A230|nr:uncharacterized protein LOC119178242 [Rhipicephalus microplus]XP_037285333.1 uncharacterized protein LOC119178242 [Rhipicephalus microplus]
MKRTSIVLFLLISCLMFVSSYKLLEKDETLDVVVDKQAERLGAEAIQVGQILRAISHGLRNSARTLDGAENQAQQYFFKKIINVVKTVGSGAVDLAKVVGKTVEDTIKAAKSFYSFEETPTTKAADILQKLAVKDLSLYALEDGKAYNDFRHHFAEKLSRVAEPLIKKGEALCSCRGRTQLDEIEAKFVDVVVKAF